MNVIKLIYTINNSGIIVLLASMISVMIAKLIRHKGHNFLYIDVIEIILWRNKEVGLNITWVMQNVTDVKNEIL